MDFDGSPVPNAPNVGEIDHNLLLQFSCMNTTDREELIGQMQRLLGPSLTSNTATFFLDMSNWNLQAAICCYLDYTLPPRAPLMALRGGTGHEPKPPGACFEHSWRIGNTGLDAWPAGCRIIHTDGESLGATPEFVPMVPAGEDIVVTIKLIAPTQPGFHRGYYHLVNDRGEKIGDKLWAEVIVKSDMTMALVHQLAALPVPSSLFEDSSNITQVPQQDDQMC